LSKSFINENPPSFFSYWVVENLSRCFSRDNMIDACKLNIEDHPEDKHLFENLIDEMYMYSHSKVLNHYKEMLRNE